MTKKRATSKWPYLDIPLNTLQIEHQDKKLSYRLTNGGYAFDEENISISVSTEAVNDEQHPRDACIALEQYPIAIPLKSGAVLECNGGRLNHFDHELNHVLTKGHGYFGFHAEEIFMRWSVISIGWKYLTVGLEATHDDVNYYDEHAKRTPTRGMFRLEKKQVSELWFPV